MSSAIPPWTDPGGADETVPGSSLGDVGTIGGTGASGSFGAVPQAGERIGSFVVERVLGSGAMGVVVLAHDPELDRPVAIKLLAPRYGQDERAQQRLLREAQAIAKLSHPHVVAVFQAGTHGDRVYVVMELVDGGTLRQWVSARPRTCSEIVAAYEQAAYGLAAAHAAGLVHRDFKPDNALVGRDGRVRVSDFGLVAASGGAPSGPSGTLVASTADERLTQTGAVMGTPAYMAPEQLGGRSIDHRADQFAFCVSLWEALHGERPFAGDNALAVFASIASGVMRSPRRSDVPAALHAAIVRGLSSDPGARHPSMPDLVAAIRRAMAPPRPGSARVVALVAGVAALLAVVLGLAFAWSRGGDAAVASTSDPSATIDEHDSACAPIDRTLAGQWTPEAHARLDAAFSATGIPSFADRAGRARRAIDAYVELHEKTRRDACLADEASRDEAVSPARAHCLHDARVELVAVIELLSGEPAREIADSAAAIVAGLPQPTACLDVEFLKARPPAPEHAERDALRARFRRAYAAAQVSRMEDARAEATAVHDAALAAKDPALAAEALVVRGHVLRVEGDAAAAEADLAQAIEHAQAGHDPLVELQARRERMLAVAAMPGRAVAAKSLVEGVLAAQARAHAKATDWAVHGAMAELDSMAGDPTASLAALDGAIAGLEALAWPRPDQLGIVLVFRGMNLQAAGRVIEAEAAYRLAIGVQTEALGIDHAAQAGGLRQLVGLMQQLGRNGEMLELARRWVAVLEAAEIGEGQLGEALAMLGWAHQVGFDYASAKSAYERALPLLREDPSAGRNEAATSMRLGEVELALGDTARAEELLEQATVLAKHHPDVADSIAQGAYVLRGSIAAMRGDRGKARRHYEDALTVRQRLFGPGPELVEAHLLVAELDVSVDACDSAAEHIDAAAKIQGAAAARRDDLLVRTSLAQAQCAMLAADFDKARRSLDQASDRVARGGLDPMMAANVKLVRAKLAHREGDREAAVRIASEARDELAALGPQYAAQVRIAETFVEAYSADAPE